MKPSTSNAKVLSGRRPGPARPAAAPDPAYLEALVAVDAGASPFSLPRVLHVDTEAGTATVLASLLGSAVHVTHVASVAEAYRMLHEQIFSLVILDPALPDGDAGALLPLLVGTPLLVYADRQPEWRELAGLPFLAKSDTSARQLWTGMAALLWNSNIVSGGD
jgi:two-component system phosphate regulon response regulator OmpR